MEEQSFKNNIPLRPLIALIGNSDTEVSRSLKSYLENDFTTPLTVIQLDDTNQLSDLSRLFIFFHHQLFSIFIHIHTLKASYKRMQHESLLQNKHLKEQEPTPTTMAFFEQIGSPNTNIAFQQSQPSLSLVSALLEIHPCGQTSSVE